MEFELNFGGEGGLDAIDVEQFNADMTALLRGEEVELPSFDFRQGKRVWKGHKLTLKADSVVIVEGLHALNPVLLPENIDISGNLTIIKNSDETQKTVTGDVKVKLYKESSLSKRVSCFFMLEIWDISCKVL